jgi:hypothetical protein
LCYASNVLCTQAAVVPSPPPLERRMPQRVYSQGMPTPRPTLRARLLAGGWSGASIARICSFTHTSAPRVLTHSLVTKRSHTCRRQRQGKGMLAAMAATVTSPSDSPHMQGVSVHTQEARGRGMQKWRLPACPVVLQACR